MGSRPTAHATRAERRWRLTRYRYWICMHRGLLFLVSFFPSPAHATCGFSRHSPSPPAPFSCVHVYAPPPLPLAPLLVDPCRVKELQPAHSLATNTMCSFLSANKKRAAWSSVQAARPVPRRTRARPGGVPKTDASGAPARPRPDRSDRAVGARLLGKSPKDKLASLARGTDRAARLARRLSALGRPESGQVKRGSGWVLISPAGLAPLQPAPHSTPR